MIRNIALGLVLALSASFITQIGFSSEASAQSKGCRYTSQDKAQGYRC